MNFENRIKFDRVKELQQFIKKARFTRFWQTELFEKQSKPSRAELFCQKLEPKPSQTEPSLGSDTSLEKTQSQRLKQTKNKQAD